MSFDMPKISDKPTHNLAVIIINYRTPRLVLECLEALASEINPTRDEVVVVDNESGDGSASKIECEIARRSWGGWVRLIEAGRNGGFSAGNNAGIRTSDAEYYLLLNSDTLVRPGAVAELLRAAKELPRAGLIGPRLENQDGTAQSSSFRRIGVLSQFVRAASTRFVDFVFPRGVISLPISDEQHTCEWISFACVLIRRDIVLRVGLMDESMFMYFEDADYSLRVRKLDFDCWYWPHARVVHLGGGSGAMRANARPPRFYYASRSRYFVKHFGESGWVLANLLWIFGRMIFYLKSFASGRLRHAEFASLKDVWIRSALTPGGRFGTKPVAVDTTWHCCEAKR